MTKYLSVDWAIALNAEHCGPGAGVLDRGGIEAQMARAYSGFGGFDLYPSVWQKAAVLIHGLASTQYFSDGNKRTAWLLAVSFLAHNDAPLRDIPDVEAEAFVLAVAVNLFDTYKAAEWLEGRRLRASDRCHFAILATSASVAEGSMVDMKGGGCNTIAVAEVPAFGELALVTHIRWAPIDALRERTIRVWIEDQDGPLAIWNPAEGAPPITQIPTAPFNHDWVFNCTPLPAADRVKHPSGMHPHLIAHTIQFLIRKPGDAVLRMDIDDDLFAEIRLSVQVVDFAPFN